VQKLMLNNSLSAAWFFCRISTDYGDDSVLEEVKDVIGKRTERSIRRRDRILRAPRDFFGQKNDEDEVSKMTSIVKDEALRFQVSFLTYS
jgi:hypothetical protein